MRFDPLSLWRYADAVIEPGAPRRAWRRLRYVRQSLQAPAAFRAAWAAPQAAALRRRLAEDPRLAGFSVWPYMNRHLAPQERIALLAAHENWRQRCVPWAPAAVGEAPVRLVDLGSQMAGLGLWLEYAPWFIREGSLNLSLMLDGERLITLAFSMRPGPQGLEACIGAIQGSNRDDAVEVYKAVAEAANDLRPRDLILKAFRLLAQALDVEQLACVADDSHAQLHAYFGGTKTDRVFLRYDDLWLEQGATLGADGFYRMPAVIPDRPLSDVPTKKRGRYKRRLEMFAAWQAQMRQRLAQLNQPVSAGGQP